MQYRNIIHTLLLAIMLLAMAPRAFAQPGTLIDEVIANVGDNVILLSDVESQYIKFRMQGNIDNASAIRCQILDNLLFQKLLLTQAQLDSVEISDQNVDAELDRRIRYYISQFGSKEKFEEFYDKSIVEIKEDFREIIRDQMMTEQVQATITADVKITPSEVKSYYQQLAKDSLPLINTEYQIGQIVRKPEISQKEFDIARAKIKEIRDRVMAGEKFETLAVLYSEDPGSAKEGGSIGTIGRGETYPAFEATAFNLKKGEISDIVKSQAGYHIIQMIQRKGDYVDVNHILIRPKVNPYDLQKAYDFVDSIAMVIKSDTLTFEEAAKKYSDDPGKINGGMLINPYTGSTWFSADELDPQLFFTIDKLEVGEISKAVKMTTEEGTDAFRIVYLKTRTTPHRANLKDDYNKIQQWAQQEKEANALATWVKNKSKKTYVTIDEKYLQCPLLQKWVAK
ncbi:MAG: peptidylprolyl isomerase [Bacteroidetes bacterium]|nr:MAG: peptidylprolyl isomerase [Bacteroidota bacterium]